MSIFHMYIDQFCCNLPISCKIRSDKSYVLWGLLIYLSGFGRKDVVEYLLQCGANVHARDDGGLIPLHNACSFGHAEVVQLLLKHGADANSRDNWNYTPLHEAAIKGKIDVCTGKFRSIVHVFMK